MHLLQIEDAAMEYFDAVVKQDNIIINYNVPLQPEYLPEYIEGWRRKIWDQGFAIKDLGHTSRDQLISIKGTPSRVSKVPAQQFAKFFSGMFIKLSTYKCSYL